MNLNSFANIKREASRIARDAGVEGIVPTPLETIAHSLGYQSLAFQGSGDVAGAIDHQSRRIFVNSADHFTRQRFTLAHELGHATLHSGDGGNIVDYRKNMEGGVSDRKEVEANFFAAHLLMPDDLFRRAWALREGNIKRVAQHFGVSEQAASIKASSIGLA